MKITLGPLLYYWPQEQVEDLYRQVVPRPVATVYLGETVCSKRRALTLEQWIEIGERLQQAGKEVVLSTLTLLEAESELKGLRRICHNGRFLVEANDLAAVNLCQQADLPFVAGHPLNLYNPNTLSVMARAGMVRWVMPVELSREALAGLQQERPRGVETELFAWGRLPLAYSARCYTARHHKLPKDDCQFRCLDDPEGMLLNTREGQPFLVLNGIQTQSALHTNLVGALAEMEQLGVDRVRISPQATRLEQVVQLFDQVLEGGVAPSEGAIAAERLLPLGGVDGYWRGEAGIEPLVAV